MPYVWERCLIVHLPHIYPVLWQPGAADTRTTLRAVEPGKPEYFQPLKDKMTEIPSNYSRGAFFLSWYLKLELLSTIQEQDA